MEENIQLKGRPLISGNAKGEAIVVKALSFYGEVDPRTGRITDGRSIKNKILIIGRPRGSTVGSYTLYGLKYYDNLPLAIIVESNADPILVAGAVLASIPLVDNVEGILDYVNDGDIVLLYRDGSIEIMKNQIRNLK